MSSTHDAQEAGSPLNAEGSQTARNDCLVGAAGAQRKTLRDLHERCLAFEVVLGCLTLPLLRSAPPEVSTALLAGVRTIVPQLIDDPAVDQTRVLGHITDFVNQLDLVLKLVVSPDATRN